ncbi:MAG: YbjQ family protein [Agarilytica sp.]
MINKPCVSCNKPMNGGVYRKPNQCPHCLSLQDESLTVDRKPIKIQRAKDAIRVSEMALAEAEGIVSAVEVIDQEMVPDSSAEVVPREVHLEADADLGRHDYIVAELEEGDDLLVLEDFVTESADSVLEFPSVAFEHEKAEGLEISLDNVEEESGEVEKPIALPEYANVRHFHNLEITPDVDESLDVALDMASVANAGAVTQIASEKPIKVSDKKITPEAPVIQGDKVVTLKGRAGARRGNESWPVSHDEPHESPVLVEHAGDDGDKRSVAHVEYESVVLTTESAQNVDIAKRLDIVSAECVFGTDMVKSNLPSKGHPSKIEHIAPPSILKDARKTVLDEIKKEAFLLGANTVVEVKLDYSEISRGESAMMLVVATGTAVNTA